MRLQKTLASLLIGASTLIPYRAEAPVLLFYKPEMGVNVAKFSDYNLDDNAHAIGVLQEQGFRTIVINPVYYQENSESSAIEQKSRCSIEDIALISRFSKQWGLKTAIKPLVNTRDDMPRQLYEPANIKHWESSYSSIIMNLTQTAIEWNTDYFIIGTEIDYIASENPNYFNALIGNIRRAGYNGKILYSAGFTGSNDYAIINRLNKLNIDAIGIDFYPPVVIHDNAASDDDISDYLRRISRESKKPIYLTEVGYKSVEHANKSPYNYQLRGKPDSALQAVCYKNFLDAIRRFNTGNNYIRGIFLWTSDKSDFIEDLKNPDSIGYSLKAPAREIIEKFNKQ